MTPQPRQEQTARALVGLVYHAALRARGEKMSRRYPGTVSWSYVCPLPRWATPVTLPAYAGANRSAVR